MHLTKEDRLFGVPAMAIRDSLREFARGRGTLYDALSERFPPPEAKRLLQELELGGYTFSSAGSREPQLTESGNGLRMASAAKQITRKTAERLLGGFIERAHRVNTDPYYYFRVSKVVVFGSYLTGVDRLTDIDIVCTLQRKAFYQSNQRTLMYQRGHVAIANGRNFQSHVDFIWWPHTEVLRFLKSGSRSFSLHDEEDTLVLGCKTKILLDEPFEITDVKAAKDRE